MPTAVLVDYIDQHRDRSGVEPICEVLESAGTRIAPSTYYAAKTRPPSARTVRDAELVLVIGQVHKDNIGVYSARKVHAEVNRKGTKVARCTVERLMKAAGLRGISRDKTRKTTTGDGAETERPADLVERQFAAQAPNRLWVADLTYVRTHSGWVYAAFILDVFSRMVMLDLATPPPLLNRYIGLFLDAYCAFMVERPKGSTVRIAGRSVAVVLGVGTA
ncbi:IS3 family transposase [Kribbella qitaiheensis]|uniref:IS3 family transposase n=1 Tax=Kribbella qitaiheensis TaxID=1544730 RepID=UPI0036D29EE3